MEKDAVPNQKAWVRLAAVLDLQKRYLQTVQEYQRVKADEAAKKPGDIVTTSLICWSERKRTFEQIIKVLELPIEMVT